MGDSPLLCLVEPRYLAAAARLLLRASTKWRKAVNADDLEVPTGKLSENAQREFSPRQREALWKLAVVDEPVKRDFISVLVNNPKDLIRVSRGFAQISRALGILRPTPTEGETLIRPRRW